MRYNISSYLILILSFWSVHGFLGRFGRRKHYQNGQMKELREEERLFIEQPVDNFNKSDLRKWKNLYTQNDEYFKKDGSIILFIMGESTLHSWCPTLVKSLAQKTNGLIVAIEHRYYGVSLPSEDMKYLSAKQALADMANLIMKLKKDNKFKKSKVVTVGGSYGGMLSAWMRAHYPHLVDAAISSSAPLLAKAAFYEYLDKVSEGFEKYGPPGCVDMITNYFQGCLKSFSSDEGIKAFKKENNICESSDLKNKYNQQYYLELSVDGLAGRIQMGTPNSIKEWCQKNNQTEKRKLFFALNNVENLFDTDKKCIDVDFESLIKQIKGNLDEKSWTYQFCSEFGFLQAASNKSLFKNTITLDYYYTECKVLFGIDEKLIDENVKKTNKYYGGLKPNVTNVVFFNGGMDPWSILGVKHDLNEKAPLKVVPDAAHCADMTDYMDNREDLTKLKEYEVQTIINWIK